MFSPSLREQRDHEITRPVASAARTVTGNSGALHIGRQPETVTAFVDVTAVSGTSPTLVVHLDVSPDGGTTWYLGVASTATLNATGQTRLTSSVYQGTVLTPVYRLRWVIGGTGPSFTFSVDTHITAN